MQAPAHHAPDDLADSIVRHGHVFVPGAQMRARLTQHRALTDWAEFAASWNDLQLDPYMADQGRYRRRRHAVYLASAPRIVRQPHQPHYQSRDYNPLNGGTLRWFEPVAPAIGDGATLRAILHYCHGLFSALAGAATPWHVEVHQFRIEASRERSGLPTPEGVHRDGVDYVLVLLVLRQNIASGTTLIETPQGQPLGSFTLTQPCDAVLVDDQRVAHGVTPVMPLDPMLPAYRDVLVVTFRKAS